MAGQTDVFVRFSKLDLVSLEVGLAYQYHAGIEGGGTGSTAVIVDASGKILSKCEGPCTNPWLVGAAECSAHIAKMIATARDKAGIPAEYPLQSLGLALSGGEKGEQRTKLIDIFKNMELAKSYHFCLDALGSMATTNPGGGIVVIAGTGQNTFYFQPKTGKLIQCGGWGDRLGDFGSAYWISHLALMTVYYAEEAFSAAPHNIDTARRCIWDYFKMDDRFAILPHLYPDFDKGHIAGLCRRLAEAADKGDALCRWFFDQAGGKLATTITAVLSRVDEDPVICDEIKETIALIAKAEGPAPQDGSPIEVLCVGGVWNSWPHLKPGFVRALGGVKLKLYRPAVSSAIGAAILGALSAGHRIQMDYDKNKRLLADLSG